MSHTSIALREMLNTMNVNEEIVIGVIVLLRELQVCLLWKGKDIVENVCWKYTNTYNWYKEKLINIPMILFHNKVF